MKRDRARSSLLRTFIIEPFSLYGRIGRLKFAVTIIFLALQQQAIPVIIFIGMYIISGNGYIFEPVNLYILVPLTIITMLMFYIGSAISILKRARDTGLNIYYAIAFLGLHFVPFIVPKFKPVGFLCIGCLLLGYIWLIFAPAGFARRLGVRPIEVHAA